MKNTKSSVVTSGNFTFASSTATQVVTSNTSLPRAAEKALLIPFLESNHKLVRRHSIDSNGGGYEGL